MDDGASCTTFARRFSSRYTHAHDEEPIAPSPGSQPSTYGMRPNSAIPSPLSISDSPLQSPSKRGHSAGSNLHGGYQSRLQRPGSHGGYEEAAEEEIYAAANHQINEGEDFPGADLDGQEDYESMSPGKSPKMEVSNRGRCW